MGIVLRFMLWLAALGCVPAQAQTDFYRGKTVTVVVSTSTGGGYDAIARAIARHIGRHVPGNPNFVIRNMPGAGGIAAVNWLLNVAEQDCTVVGLVSNATPLEPLCGTKEARFDATRLHWLGCPSLD